jgi:hypothetical protein
VVSRRGLITGLISLAAAPAIVRASSLMPVKAMEPVLTPQQIAEALLRSELDRVFAAASKNLNRLLYGGYEFAWTGYDNRFYYRPVSDRELFHGR